MEMAADLGANAAELSTNSLVIHEAPAWLKARVAERSVERIERHLEWDLRKIHVWFYSDSARFNQAHGLRSSQVTVFAFTKPADLSVHFSPGITAENFDRFFGHELVHVMLRQKFKGSVPPWLEEGVANTFGAKGARPVVSLKLDYPWILAQAGARDLRQMRHPFRSEGGEQAKFHYQASTALVEFIRSRCDLEQLLQLSVKKSVESYLPTLCEIRDLNAEFRSFLRARK